MNHLLADDSHEIPSFIFSEKKKNRMSSATSLLSALRVKAYFKKRATLSERTSVMITTWSGYIFTLYISISQALTVPVILGILQSEAPHSATHRIKTSFTKVLPLAEFNIYKSFSHDVAIIQ